MGRKVSALGRQRGAVERQVEALATGAEHSALVEACRQLADQIDASDSVDDKLWREYRLALTLLMGETRPDGGGDGDPWAELEKRLRATVDDATDREA